MLKFRGRVKKFFELEASTGILLVVSTIFALMIANSDEVTIYESFLSIKLPIIFESIAYYKHLTLRDWINDGLMAIFFFLVGLELKKEVLDGDLSTKSKLALPAIGAIGGVVVPALIFLVLNHQKSQYIPGFAIPVATDIAFAYGMLCLFGKRITNSAKIYLVALAVIDDLVAILIIAFFYTKEVSVAFLLVSSFAFIGLILLNYFKSKNIYFYMGCGVFLWFAILKSGVHATIAGVLMAMFIPLKVGSKEVLHAISKKIAPIVNSFVLPVFVFANAGVTIESFQISDLYSDALILGIIIGLFVGKQAGIFLSVYIAIKLKLASLPRGTNWVEFYGVSIFAGIGFTMSLFIGSLAFIDSPDIYDRVKVAVLAGSLMSTLYGLFVTYIATARFSGR